MTYLISNIMLTLIATLVLGVGIGWLIWGRLKSRLTSLETDWRERYQALDNEYQSVIIDYNEVELALKDRVAHISGLNNEKNELSEQLSAATNASNELGSEFDEIKKQLTQTTAHLRFSSKELEEYKQQLATFQNTPNEINELKTLLGQATQRYNKNGLELENKNEELAALQNQFDEINMHSNSIRKELDLLRTQLLKRDKEFENQVVSYANLQNQLNDSNEMLKMVQTELESRDRNSVDRAELKARNEKIVILQNSLQEVSKNHQDALAELNNTKRQIPALNNEVSSLRDQILALESSLKQRDSSISALENEITRLANEFPPLRDEIELRTSESNEYKQQVYTLQQRIPALKSTIAARDAHIRELEVFINEVQKAILQPSNLALVKNGNSHVNGKSKNGNGASNGNVIHLNGNDNTIVDGNGASKTNGVASVANGNGKVKQNASTKAVAKTPGVNGKATQKTTNNKLKPYGLKKPTRKPDDLKLITGIGETLEKTLHKCGIFYFEQIANFNLKDVKTVDELLNFRGRIDRDDWIKQARNLMKANKNAIAVKKASVKRTPQHQRTTRKPKMKPLGMKRPSGELDDLQLINGVGPTLERKLHRLGIYHYEQLAQLRAEDIALIDSKLKTYKGRLKRDKWPMQARKLHKEFYAGV